MALSSAGYPVRVLTGNGAHGAPKHAADERPPPTSSEIFDVTGAAALRQHDAEVSTDLDFTIASFLASPIAERSHLMFMHRADGTVVDYRWWHPASEPGVRVEFRAGGPTRIHETGTRHLWAELASILAV